MTMFDDQYKFFLDFDHSTKNPMGLEYHEPVKGVRGFARLSAYIEKFIFPSLLCIVIYSQTVKKQAKGEYEIYHI